MGGTGWGVSDCCIVVRESKKCLFVLDSVFGGCERVKSINQGLSVFALWFILVITVFFLCFRLYVGLFRALVLSFILCFICRFISFRFYLVDKMSGLVLMENLSSISK